MHHLAPVGLREAVESAVISAFEHLGPNGLDKAAIASQFGTKGVSRSTFYRWIDATLASGKPAARLQAVMASAAAVRAERVADPAADAARSAASLIPHSITPDSLLTPSAAGISAVGLIQQCIAEGQLVIKDGKQADGVILKPMQILAGCESIRKSLETLMRLRKAMLEGRAEDAFQEAVIREIAKESPACAERIYHALLHLTAGQTG